MLEAENQPEFRHVPLSRSEIQEGIDLWLSEGLIKKVGVFDSEIRYCASNRHIQIAMNKCWELYDYLLTLICRICRMRSPKKEEKQWLTFFYGDESNSPIDQWLAGLRHDRRNMINRYTKKEKALTRKFARYIQREFKKLAKSHWMTKQLWFLVEKLLEYIYPPFMQRLGFNNNV